MADWIELQREGTRLACLDYGGEGPPAVILPGLAGHAGQWAHLYRPERWRRALKNFLDSLDPPGVR